MPIGKRKLKKIVEIIIIFSKFLVKSLIFYKYPLNKVRVKLGSSLELLRLSHKVVSVPVSSILYCCFRTSFKLLSLPEN